MARIMKYYVYIMSNIHRTVFYIGVTSNIQTRIWQHKNGEGGKFTSTYKCHCLLFYEKFNQKNKDIERKKKLKNWHRELKLNLIKAENPELIDLAAGW